MRSQYTPMPMPLPYEYKVIAATDISSFNELLKSEIAEGWNLERGEQLIVTPHRDSSGYGMQYSILLYRTVRQK